MLDARNLPIFVLCTQVMSVLAAFLEFSFRRGLSHTLAVAEMQI